MCNENPERILNQELYILRDNKKLYKPNSFSSRKACGLCLLCLDLLYEFLQIFHAGVIPLPGDEDRAIAVAVEGF